MNILIVICLIILIILAVLNLLALIKQGRRDSETNSDEIIALNNQLKEYISEQNRNNRIEINTTLTNSIRNMADIITDSQKASNNNQLQQLSSLEKRMENLSNSNEMRLDKIRETVESRL
ncbi:MAG: hypothetical protein II233_01705, partial [Clostridia bacterium]|nr:hypothetical protein [Clostridia bacterium]